MVPMRVGVLASRLQPVTLHVLGMEAQTMAGPLDGLKLVEMAGLGPCPLAGQLLADLGGRGGRDRPKVCPL